MVDWRFGQIVVPHTTCVMKLKHLAASVFQGTQWRFDAPARITEVGLNQLRTQGLKKFGLLSAVLMMMLTLFAAPSIAHAEDAIPYTISGTLLNSTDEGKVPIEGVKLVATAEDGKTFEATSDAEGLWTIEVPGAGIYKVELDQTTLPEGVALREGQEAVREVDLSSFTEEIVLFKFGVKVNNTQSVGDQFLIRLFSGINFGLLLAMAAIGISLIFGTTGLSNFAHGEMVTIGALFMWVFYSVFQLNIIVAAVAAIAVSAALGWVQDAGLWKPLRKRRLGLNQMMIVSIGFSIVARYLLLLFFGGDTKDIAGNTEFFNIGPVRTSWVTISSMVISVLALAGVAYFLTQTRTGKAARAVSDNPSLAAATGIDVERIIRIVWVFAAALTGLAGVLYGLQFQANWMLGFDILLLLFAAVTLGGLGTALGAAVGAMIIGLVVDLSVMIVPNELRYATALVILIVILIVRPQGVLGKKQRIG